MDTQIKTSKKLSAVGIGAGVFLLAFAGGLIASLLWTNNNTHDPGITIAEALDYSINDRDSDKPYDDHKKYNTE